MKNTTGTAQMTEILTDKLHRLLQQFHEVFETPTHLPPFGHCDHQMVLQQVAETVKARRYCYSRVQK